MTVRKAKNAEEVKDGQSEEGSGEADQQAGSETGTQGSHEGNQGAVSFVYSDVIGRIIDVPGQGSRIFQPGDTIDSNIDPRYFKEIR
jgi:hypothetical protein